MSLPPNFRANAIAVLKAVGLQVEPPGSFEDVVDDDFDEVELGATVLIGLDYGASWRRVPAFLLTEVGGRRFGNRSDFEEFLEHWLNWEIAS